MRKREKTMYPERKADAKSKPYQRILSWPMLNISVQAAFADSIPNVAIQNHSDLQLTNQKAKKHNEATGE